MKIPQKMKQELVQIIFCKGFKDNTLNKNFAPILKVEIEKLCQFNFIKSIGWELLKTYLHND